MTAVASSNAAMVWAPLAGRPATYGRIDTWVNDAAVSIYGRLDEVRDEDSQRLFQTNFWGLVYGSFIAAEHLRDRGGALINMGSVVSDQTIPLAGSLRRASTRTTLSPALATASANASLNSCNVDIVSIPLFPSVTLSSVFCRFCKSSARMGNATRLGRKGL